MWATERGGVAALVAPPAGRAERQTSVDVAAEDGAYFVRFWRRDCLDYCARCSSWALTFSRIGRQHCADDRALLSPGDPVFTLNAGFTGRANHHSTVRHQADASCAVKKNRRAVEEKFDNTTSCQPSRAGVPAVRPLCMYCLACGWAYACCTGVLLASAASPGKGLSPWIQPATHVYLFRWHLKFNAMFKQPKRGYQ